MNRFFCSAAYILFQGLIYGQYSLLSTTAGTVSSSEQTGSQNALKFWIKKEKNFQYYRSCL